MDNKNEMAKDVLARLERESLINLHTNPIQIDYNDGELTLTGETETIAAKKTALAIAGKTPGISAIIDRLHVQPAERMEDGEIRIHICNAILAEQLLEPYALRAWVKGNLESARETVGTSGVIEVEVQDGLVTLNGQVG